MNGFKLRGNDFYVFWTLQNIIPHSQPVELRAREISSMCNLSLDTVKATLTRLDVLGFISRKREARGEPYQYVIRRRNV